MNDGTTASQLFDSILKMNKRKPNEVHMRIYSSFLGWVRESFFLIVNPNLKPMKKYAILLLFSALLAACGLNQQKTGKPGSGNPGTGNQEANKSDTVKANSTSEFGMWKIASYASDLGDNKNSFYITNAFAIWGTYSNNSVDNSELKVKFLIDKVSFCFKLYEYGKKIVKKGDESSYQITLKSSGVESFQISAKNVSDRIFINETDAKKLIELFGKGIAVSFSLTNDSKTNPSSYAFILDHPEGISGALKKIAN